MLERNLKSEDGASFFGLVERQEVGQVRATCYAQLDREGGVRTESPEHMMFATVDEAKEWIKLQAERRSFSEYSLKME